MQNGPEGTGNDTDDRPEGDGIQFTAAEGTREQIHGQRHDHAGRRRLFDRGPQRQFPPGPGRGVVPTLRDGVFFRYYGLFPEGVTYAILLMNALVWTIDRYTAPRRFGVKKGGAAK